MSSIPEKSQPLCEAPSTSPKPSTSMVSTFFFRSDSIRKIKCTAVYPFQVAGIRLSKNVIIQLLETNFMKAHACTQKTMLNFYYVVLKLLSTLFTLWINKVPVKAPARHISMDRDSNCAIKTKESITQIRSPSIDTFHSRLQEKLRKITQHKNRLNGDRHIPSISNTQSSISDPQPSTSSSESPSTSGRLSPSSAASFRTFNLRPEQIAIRNKFQQCCLFACVHVGLVVMYLQVVILGMALHTTIIPTGLIFMLVTIGIIGYIFVMVSLVGKKSRTTKSPRSSPLSIAKNSSASGRDLIQDDDSSPERHSRSKAKKCRLSLELKYKTLSKVKLL